MFFMQAVVLERQQNRLLVLDLDTRQRVSVNTPMARFFRPGDQVSIWYSGAQTRSIPPQISAQYIVRTSSEDLPPAPPPMRPPQPRPPVFFPPVFRPPWNRGPRD